MISHTQDALNGCIASAVSMLEEQALCVFVCLFVCAYVRMCVQGIRVKPCEGHSVSVRPDLWRRDRGDG